LPDHWPDLEQRLSTAGAACFEAAPAVGGHGAKKVKLAWTATAALVLILTGVLTWTGQLQQWFVLTGGTSRPYTQATSQGGQTTGQTRPAGSTHSPDQLALSDWANQQYSLMEQAQVPEQYPYYAGSFIAYDFGAYIILVTCKPDQFINQYAELLDFSRIVVRQVPYALKELQAAYEPLYQAFLASDRLVKLGVMGMAVYEQENAILIVAQDVTPALRREVAKWVADPDMIVYEVGNELIPG
jgi:hypothetical protein